MPYWMTNDEHGITPAYDTGEVERLKTHGWKVLNEGARPLRPGKKAEAKPSAAPAPEAPAPVAAPVAAAAPAAPPAKAAKAAKPAKAKKK